MPYIRFPVLFKADYKRDRELLCGSQARDEGRTDIIVDYPGEQYVVELKIWRGNAYHERGERQLLEYLEAYRLERGYLLSFNFNKKKEVGK